MKSKGKYIHFLRLKEEITYLWHAILVGTGICKNFNDTVLLFSGVATSDGAMGNG